MSQEAVLTLEEQTPRTVQGAMLALVALLLGHTVVDLLAALVPSSLGVLELRVGMTAQQSAWLMGVGPLVSGLSQPVCALLSDRHRTRIWGVVGLALTAVGICSLALASRAATLVTIYVVAIAGAGMFHPVAAATVGFVQQHRRNRAVSLFFVTGMVGGVLGAYTWPRFLTADYGFQALPYLMVPGVALAAVTLWSLQQLPKPRAVHEVAADDPIPSSHWKMVGLLYLAACLRFCVNTALFYLYVRWPQVRVAEESPDWTLEQVTDAAAPLAGSLQASTFVGMAMGGLLAGQFVTVGREKGPMFLVPLCLAPSIALFPFVSVEVGYVLAVLAGIGFASMIPINIALAQRLLPHRANLASSLMMGGAWSVAVIGPPLAQWCSSCLGMDAAFFLTAAMLAVSGLLCLPIRTNGK